ncbi:MAG: hypothetical protein V2A79_03805 [Planctomycetota bacterium]
MTHARLIAEISMAEFNEWMALAAIEYEEANATVHSGTIEAG